MQYAKALGTEVTGVTSTRNLELVRAIGADHVVDYTKTDFSQTGQHYDLVFDTIGNISISAARAPCLLRAAVWWQGSPPCGISQRFLTQHRTALEKLPVAIFSLGPTRRRRGRQKCAPHSTPEWASPWLKPVAVELFGGKYDPAKLRFPDSLLKALPASPLHGVPASDIREFGRHRCVGQGPGRETGLAMSAGFHHVRPYGGTT